MNRVLELRTSKSMSQEDFAVFCGVARSSVARFEAGENIGRASAEKIARACGVSVSYVLGDTTISTNDTTSPAAAPAPAWNAVYPPGVALRTAQPRPQPSVALSDADIALIAERVAALNREAPSGVVYTPVEQQLVEEFRMLSPAQRTRVQRLIATFLDSKFSGE